MGEVIKGRMFADLYEDYDAFFEYGPGAMCWGTRTGYHVKQDDTYKWIEDGVERRVLHFLSPPVPSDGRRFDKATIYTETDGKDWCQPGPVKGWDGNLEKPTFNPSIWLGDKRGWHGFIRNGDLVTA